MSKGNIIIIHGCPSRREHLIDIRKDNAKHWIPWVRMELEKLDLSVSTPLMPTPWDRNYLDWKKEFEKELVNENTVLVGHSCGCTFLIRWLGETKKKIRKIILVAPSILPNENNKKRDYTEWYDFKIDHSISKRVGDIVIFVSDNDESKIIRSAESVHKELGGKLIELKGKGHFTFGDLGSREFPELLKEIINK
jgi:predicted alpha/beta hydrolase family esterase